MFRVDHFVVLYEKSTQNLKKTKIFCLLHSKEINHEIKSSLNNRLIKSTNNADFIIANGTSCRHQISDLSHKKGKHVSELLFKIFETVN